MINKNNWHLTNSCNYHCTYCFGKFPETNMLSIEQAHIVVDNIARYFIRNKITDGAINLAGGEPLLYPHLDELIDYINEYGIKVSIITNGSLLTEARIAAWKGKVDCIGLSIDSALPETNLKIGRCCLNKAMRMKHAVQITQAIHRNKITLKINIVVSKFNVNEDMTGLLKSLKPDRVKFLQMSTVDGINEDAEKYAISKKAFLEFCNRHKKCCYHIVKETCDDMENSYLMINPQGEIQLNNGGKYETYGSCIKEEIYDIIKRVPLDERKFQERSGKSCESTADSKKICIFGGHETWLKAIKKQVNARFFKSGDLHSLDVIRNADEIWIQPNAISHSFYGKVLAAARSNHVAVYYFDCASARKCAEQLVQG